jgi:hypothetical protein
MLSASGSHSCEKSSSNSSSSSGSAKAEQQPSNVDGINKPSSSSSSRAFTEEITEGNCLVAVDKGERPDEKINTTPKKRFFDLKRTAESAVSKVKSPSRFSLNNLTPRLRRKSAASHKLSQLEQHSNLFIRERGSEEERKANSSDAVPGTTLMNDVSMENGAAAVANAKNQQTTINGGESKLNKISLIPSFISPSRRLCKNPKTPVEFPNYEEIDIGDHKRDESLIAAAEANSIETFPNDNDYDDDERQWEREMREVERMMSKTELVSAMLKNIPVRQRKSVVPHMENYCLFDPAVDFCNEKELRRNNFALQSVAEFPPFAVVGKFPHLPRVVHYDISEHDERHLPFHNYYEIDPELLERDEAMAGESKPVRESSSLSSSSEYPSQTPSTSEDQEINVINHADVDNLITANATGARRKFQPQLERIVRACGSSSANSSPRKINLQLDSLKASHSLPQLEQIEERPVPIAIQLRKCARKARPLSSDSGFTTPSPPNECLSNGANTAKGASGGGSDSTVLNQCDNIQQLIEVSNARTRR